ncbi:unnamed protein product [Linum trigynum]|uniref:Uncharacterized protein n=1 Tax=Linum trigynum TaxID=586398 RepID=A0AAV2CH76_9ROSI
MSSSRNDSVQCRAGKLLAFWWAANISRGKTSSWSLEEGDDRSTRNQFWLQVPEIPLSNLNGKAIMELYSSVPLRDSEACNI